MGQTCRCRRGLPRPPPASCPTYAPAAQPTCSRPPWWPPAAPVVVCPAMHTEMWEHPAVEENLAVSAGSGSGDRPARGGPPGRRATSARAEWPIPSHRGRGLWSPCSPTGPLAGRTVLISAGGTREPIDPVRYIGNRSVGQVRATPWPRWPPPWGADGHPGHHLGPARTTAVERGSRSRLRPRCTRPCPPGPWKPTSCDHGRRGGRFPAGRLSAATRRSRRPMGETLRRTGRNRRHPGRPRCGTSRPGQVLVGFAAETEELCRDNAPR